MVSGNEAGLNPSELPRIERRRGMGCLVAAMVLVAFLGAVGFVLAGVGTAMGGVSGDHIREAVVSRVPGARRHLVWIEARGLMLEGGTGMGAGAGITRDVLAMLERATDDSAVGGVLLELDTPGGSVTDADKIHRQIRRLHDQGKKVVVLMGDVCASGGLYAAVAADHVIAMPTTITGSIGVIISGLNVADLMSQHGIRDTSIASGSNKAMLSPTLPVDPAHVEILRSVVDSMYQRFLRLISEGRNLPVDQFKSLADGRVLTADQALAAKLIDQIGYSDDAVATLRTLVGTEPLDVVRYEVEPSLFEMLKAQVHPPTAESALLARAFAAPRAMYLLSPSLGAGFP